MDPGVENVDNFPVDEKEVRAADSSAMRAALNSHLECIRIIEDIEDLTEMKP